MRRMRWARKPVRITLIVGLCLMGATIIQSATHGQLLLAAVFGLLGFTAGGFTARKRASRRS